MLVRTRFDAGEALDELGWLPDDLDSWVHCPGCADKGGDLLAMRYPVTNVQYERFILAKGYENHAWWSEPGWQWRIEPPGYRGAGPVTEPEYWRDPRLGQERRGFPVVGVSWYEANAYCRWLTEQLQTPNQELQLWRDGKLETCDLPPATFTARLPAEEEWAALAGGVQNEARYPWDPPNGPATKDEVLILARANINEAELKGPTPVGMYPLGASVPFGLMDLAGNVWEWTASEYEPGSSLRVLCGGAYWSEQGGARCACRAGRYPHYSDGYYGFRCVSPVSLLF